MNNSLKYVKNKIIEYLSDLRFMFKEIIRIYDGFSFKNVNLVKISFEMIVFLYVFLAFIFRFRKMTCWWVSDNFSGDWLIFEMKYFRITDSLDIYIIIWDALIHLIGLIHFIKNSQNNYGLPIQNPQVKKFLC